MENSPIDYRYLSTYKLQPRLLIEVETFKHWFVGLSTIFVLKIFIQFENIFFGVNKN